MGNEYQIQIGEKENSVETKGVVTRCWLKGTRKKPDTGDITPVYEAGIKFEPPLSEKANELLPVMARTASVQLAPRLFGRFSAQPDSEATLTSDLEFAVRRGDWKLYIDRDGNPRELYDLESDPLEFFDRSDSEATIVADLMSRFSKLDYAGVGD